MLNILDRRVIDDLYVEAMVLADEARSYFDYRAEEHRVELDSRLRVDFACEALKTTTRLMHVIAWLLTQRAILNGELQAEAREQEQYQLGLAAPTEPVVAESFRFEMTTLIVASEDLYDRVARLERQILGRNQNREHAHGSPARDLLARLNRLF
jgi:regulator of CtrA degradation